MLEVAGTKILSLRGAAIQLEVGGHVGEVPEAVSWEWLPGAPCSHVLRGPTHENSCSHIPVQTLVCSVRCVVRLGKRHVLWNSFEQILEPFPGYVHWFLGIRMVS